MLSQEKLGKLDRAARRKKVNSKVAVGSATVRECANRECARHECAIHERACRECAHSERANCERAVMESRMFIVIIMYLNATSINEKSKLQFCATQLIHTQTNTLTQIICTNTHTHIPTRKYT